MHVDSATPPPLAKERAFYEDVYSQSPKTQGMDYVQAAQDVAEGNNVKRQVSDFVRTYGLEHKRVLEIGSGSGTLQDIVQDYVGLDIAENARRFYHKPFVQGSATELPFQDSQFDAIWTIWTLEHVPNPTLALREMRRVLKPGGLVYLAAAWNVPTWASEAYEVRPYGELSFGEKLIKASIPLRKTHPFKALYKIPIRLIRLLGHELSRQPTDLRYTLLNPSDRYTVLDADAVNSIDTLEAYLWFVSRGDECLNCQNIIFRRSFPLVIRVRKP